MIFQIHEIHGKHVAYGTVEADANIERGWKTVSKDEFYGKKEEIEKEESKEFTMSHDDLVDLYELRFGKKPHHAMKDKTIQAKLDE